MNVTDKDLNRKEIERNGGLTRSLAEFAVRLNFEVLPAEVVSHVKLCILDTFGCALFGSTLPWSRILRSTLRDIDDGHSSTVWGTSVRLGNVHAALANGAAAHGFELDDLHKESILHPGSVVLPSVMAVGELSSVLNWTPRVLTGSNAITAIVAGYEVGARVGMSVGTAHLLAGWHPTGTHGAVAAAAAASAALRLEPEQAVNALGIAGSQSAGLMASQFSSMVKRFHAGRAAQSGVYASLLARNGYTGIRNLFESEYGGYCSTFSPTYDLAKITNGLGEHWESLRVGFKAYSTNGSCHTTIEMLLELMDSAAFTHRDVSKVIIFASSATVAHVGWPYVPDSVTTAQMNLPYIAAVVLTDRAAFVEQFSEERIRDERLVNLSRQIEVVVDPEIDRRGSAYRHAIRVEVHLRDGRIISGERQTARGSEGKPLSDEEVIEKYRALAGKALSADGVAQVEDMVGRFEQLSDLSALNDALRVNRRKTN